MKTRPLNKKKSVSDMVFKGYGIELRPVTPCDLPSLRRWRNSPQISRQMIDDSYIAPRQQRLWYERIRERVDQAHWVVWCKGVRTGYINIKGEGPLELQEQVTGGMYAGDSLVRHGLLGYAMAMMHLDIVFEYLSVSKFRSLIRKGNRSARKINQQLGCCEERCKDGFIRLTISPSDYKAAKTRLIRYFRHDK